MSKVMKIITKEKQDKKKRKEKNGEKKRKNYNLIQSEIISGVNVKPICQISLFFFS